MAAPTNAANVKKALANSEPSTHGTSRRMWQRPECPKYEDKRTRERRPIDANDPTAGFAHRSAPPGRRAV